MAKRKYADVNDKNYAGQKWTQGDIDRVASDERFQGTREDAERMARDSNKEWDRKTKLTRDERRNNEMAKDDDRIKRHALNSHTRRGNYRDAVNNHNKYSAANRRQQYESASSEGREWDDHQYIDKVKTKSGRIRYIYEDTASTGGNHAKRAKPITKNDLRYAKSEFNKGKEAISNAAASARDTIVSTGRKIDKALNDAASTISRGTTPSVNPTASGSNYVSKQMSKSANIPVKDLFK